MQGQHADKQPHTHALLRVTVKGCASTSICSNPRIPQHSNVIGAEVSCCQGDYCNSASSTKGWSSSPGHTTDPFGPVLLSDGDSSVTFQSLHGLIVLTPLFLSFQLMSEKLSETSHPDSCCNNRFA
uniref:UPAR/Ly6 domain-containing protein n=1 Tax=Monopterus albus TaxID=43700 RepID=A0A3Q3ICI7_MONAL